MLRSLPVLGVLSLSAVLSTVALGVDGAQDERDTRTAPVVLGSDEHRYVWVDDWLKLPDGMELGNTHGCVCVDREGSIYFNTDTENAIVVAAPDGKFERAMGAEWKGGLHGMTLVEEDGEEFLYISHTGRHCAAKLTLEGEVLWTLPWPEASGKYESENQYNPTGIAVAPDGTVFVADGYGRSWVHRYDAEQNYIDSFGGPGAEPGQMRTPHGLAMETVGEETYLLVCDRENRRLQRFDLEGNFVRSEEPDLERPCNGVFTAGILAVAELRGRVTLLGLDEAGEREILAHLAEQPDADKRAKNGVPVEAWRAGEFLSPHGIGADAEGNLYVMDWNRSGRMTKLERVSAMPGESEGEGR